MKIAFSKLVTTKPEVEVKADTYKSVYYDVDDAKANGISLNTDVFPKLEDIRIGDSKAKPSFTDSQKNMYGHIKVEFSMKEVVDAETYAIGYQIDFTNTTGRNKDNLFIEINESYYNINYMFSPDFSPEGCIIYNSYEVDIADENGNLIATDVRYSDTGYIFSNKLK